jgi:Tfp pilus assembly pilus retraction ATPase PilT
MNYILSDLMQIVIAEGASALHLHDGKPPARELRDCLVKIEGPPLEAGDALQMLRSIAPPEDLDEVRRKVDTLFFYRHSEAVVFGVMAFHETGSLRLELRRLTKYEDAA